MCRVVRHARQALERSGTEPGKRERHGCRDPMRACREDDGERHGRGGLAARASRVRGRSVRALVPMPALVTVGSQKAQTCTVMES
jgi:hypothetical protein